MLEFLGMTVLNFTKSLCMSSLNVGLADNILLPVPIAGGTQDIGTMLPNQNFGGSNCPKPDMSILL